MEVPIHRALFLPWPSGPHNRRAMKYSFVTALGIVKQLSVPTPTQELIRESDAVANRSTLPARVGLCIFPPP
jgi:hypothetical protein